MALSTMVLGLLLNLKVIEVSGDEDVSASLVFLLIWSAICQQGNQKMDKKYFLFFFYFLNSLMTFSLVCQWLTLQTKNPIILPVVQVLGRAVANLYVISICLVAFVKMWRRSTFYNLSTCFF